MLGGVVHMTHLLSMKASGEYIQGRCHGWLSTLPNSQTWVTRPKKDGAETQPRYEADMVCHRQVTSIAQIHSRRCEPHTTAPGQVIFVEALWLTKSEILDITSERDQVKKLSATDVDSVHGCGDLR